MTWRLVAALAVAVLLIFGVIGGQTALRHVASDLADDADEVCSALAEDRSEEGMEQLQSLIHLFERRKRFLLIFVNDMKVHEIGRALSRAQQLGEEGDASPALEALSDLSASLRELSETYLPTWENIF